MTLKRILAPFLVLSILLSFAVAFTTPAYAASSSNGLFHSGGKSAVSYRNSPGYYPFAYQYQLQNRYYQDRDEFMRAFITYLQNLINQLEQQLDDGGYEGSSDISVTTLSATEVDDEGATLRGRVYSGTEDEVTLYFAYGESRSDLDEETAHKVIDDPSSTYTFTTAVHDLDDDTVYYYRAVAEDEDGDEDYGSVLSFRTDSLSSDDEDPVLNTQSATGITDDAADLRGNVDMNDFESGLVFFVYGEDEDQIKDVSDDYDSYADVDEDDNDLQKESVDNDLDGNESYTEAVTDLDSDTRIYYSICVEYEDEDDDTVLSCGEVESFVTE